MTSRAARQGLPVTGIGCITAVGRNLDENLAGLFAGLRRMGPSARVRSTHEVRYPVFEIDDSVLPEGYAEGPECLRCGGLALVAAREAIQSACLLAADLKLRRVGVCIGTTVGSAMNNETFYRGFRDGKRPDMDAIADFLQANPSSVVARELELNGPCQTVTNACSSGTVAVGQAAEWIRAGICDIAIAGGADALCRTVYNGFAALQIMDKEPVRPFDARRCGLNLGEGAGLLVLESAASQAARGVPAVGRLVGYGNACDAFHISAPHPDGDGLRTAIETAMRQAGLASSDLAFINAHGTGTPENDRVEGQLYPDLLPDVPFLSTKGYTGHTLGASGGVEAAFSLACLNAGMLPASIGFAEPDPGFPGRPVRTNTPITGAAALSSSLAFGGNNAVIVLAKGERA